MSRSRLGHHLQPAAVGVLAALAALLSPAGASAAIAEIGVLPKSAPAAVPSCEGGKRKSASKTTGTKTTTTKHALARTSASECRVVSRTSGFQGQVATYKNPFSIPQEGRIVAWTITLGLPNETETKYFNENEGGAASAQIAILEPHPPAKRKRKAKGPAPETSYTLVAESPVIALEPYFGETAEFPLESTLAVKKGDLIALTVPTWAPALALAQGKESTWRASRPKAGKGCAETSVMTAQITIGVKRLYACQYSEARLTYSATLISTP